MTVKEVSCWLLRRNGYIWQTLVVVFCCLFLFFVFLVFFFFFFVFFFFVIVYFVFCFFVLKRLLSSENVRWTGHNISYTILCVLQEYANQLVHSRSLIRIFIFRLKTFGRLATHRVPCENPAADCMPSCQHNHCWWLCFTLLLHNGGSGLRLNDGLFVKF